MDLAPHVEIVRFSQKEHLAGAIESIREVRKSDAGYPSPVDTVFTQSGLVNWLLEEDAINRWVALIDGEVGGHISIVKAHPYLTQHLDKSGTQPGGVEGFAEISKFYVSPLYQKHGIGALLFAHALESAVAEGFTPALAVISTSVNAVRFYRKAGMEDMGYFDGVHGRNFVFLAG